MIYEFSALSPDGRPQPVDFRSDQQQLEPLLQLHNQDSQDLVTADRLAREQIRIAGAHAWVYARTDNGDYDDTFAEDPNPTYLPPRSMRCFFKPQPLELELKKWGVDAVTKGEAVFSMGELQEQFPERLIRAGDVIELPYNHPVPSLNPGLYRVLNASPSGNFRYNWLYHTCVLEALAADATVRVRQDMPEPEEGTYFG